MALINPASTATLILQINPSSINTLAYAAALIAALIAAAIIASCIKVAIMLQQVVA